MSFVTFDVTSAEAPSFTASPTEHPIELGVAVTDHVKINLARLSLECVITNTPINEVAAAVSRQEGPDGQLGPRFGSKMGFEITGYDRKQSKVAVVRGGQIPPASLRINGLPRPHTPITVEPSEYRSTPHQYGGLSLQFPERIDRVRAVFDVLWSLLVTGTELFVATGVKDYEQMIMTSLSAPRAGHDAISFSMDFVEFRRAEVRTVGVRRAPARVATKRAEPVVDAGAKPKGYEMDGRGEDLQSVQGRIQDQLLDIHDRNYSSDPGAQ
jgi:hypothetical protein